MLSLSVKFVPLLPNWKGELRLQSSTELQGGISSLTPSCFHKNRSMTETSRSASMMTLSLKKLRFYNAKRCSIKALKASYAAKQTVGV